MNAQNNTQNEKGNLLEIASEYISYTDSNEVAELLYDDYQAEIYANLNVKTKGEFIAILGDDKQYSLKELKNACNLAVDITVKYLGKLSDKELISFAQKHYDENFSLSA